MNENYINEYSLHLDGNQVLNEVFAYSGSYALISEPEARVTVLWLVDLYLGATGNPKTRVEIGEKGRLKEVLDTLVPDPSPTGGVTAVIRKDGCILAYEGRHFQSATSYRILSISAEAGGAIVIHQKRAARGERVKRFRRKEAEAEVKKLRARIAAWCLLNLEKLSETPPELPGLLKGRQVDGLVAIADQAGGEWPIKARADLLQLVGGVTMKDLSLRLQLLSDIREVFARHNTDSLSSGILVSALSTLERRTWAKFRDGAEMMAEDMDALLKPFGIGPQNVPVENGFVPTYNRSSLESAWETYLGSAPAPSPDTKHAKARQAYYEAQEKPKISRVTIG